MLDLLAKIRNSLITATAPGRTCRQVGPFFVMLSPHDDMVWMNYAVPNQSLEHGLEKHLDAMEEFFASHNRIPRFEYFNKLAPTLETELVKRGYELQGRMPMMVCTPQSFKPREGGGAQLLDADGDVTRASSIAQQAFGGPVDVDEEHTKRNREAMRAGRMKIAMSDGAAAYLVGDPEVAELCGVGTLPEFRKRGEASKVSSALMAEQFKNPSSFVWLSAGDETAKLVYEKLGFSVLCDQLNYIKQKPES